MTPPRVAPYQVRSRALALGVGAYLALAMWGGWVEGQGFDMPRRVLAAGGASASTGGTFVLGATIGQHEASGIATGGRFSVRSGFWPDAVPQVKGDFDLDSGTDLLLRHVPGSEHVAWLMSGTTRRVEASVSPNLPGVEWNVVATDDFNSDTSTDLVVRNSANGVVEFWLMRGLARVGPPVPLVDAVQRPLTWRVVAAADFNHDGWPDLLWRDTATQLLEVWTMQGTTHVGTLVPHPDHAIDANWRVVAALDFNRDTDIDLLWYNDFSGRVVLWFMDASVARITGTFATPANAGDANWRVVAAGDYGQGGAPPGTNDIVWRNDTSGNIVVWLMDDHANRTGGTFTSPPAPVSPLNWNVAGPR